MCGKYHMELLAHPNARSVKAQTSIAQMMIKDTAKMDTEGIDEAVSEDTLLTKTHDMKRKPRLINNLLQSIKFIRRYSYGTNKYKSRQYCK
jgi:hypothetical protein